MIYKVAARSGNLKGTCQRALKDPAFSIKEAVEVLHRRSITEETEKLQRDNPRLQYELSEVRKEVV